MASKASSHNRLLGWGVRAMAAAALSVLAGAGCDTPSGKADKTVDTQLTQAQTLMNGSPADRRQANALLDAAAKVNDASLPLRIRAKAMLGDSELQAAHALVAQVAEQQLHADQLLSGVIALAGEVSNANQTQAALSKYQPDPVLAKVKQQSGEVNGSDDHPDWYKTESNTLASLAADDKLAADLQGQIDKQQATLKQQVEQRNQFSTQGDQLNQQSERERGARSVDLFTQGATARKQAADLSVQIDQSKVQLGRLQADLATAQGQQAALHATLAQLEAKTSDVNDSWKALQTQIESQKAVVQKLVGDEPSPAADAKGGNTLNAKAAALADVAKRVHDLRAEAESHLNASIGLYKDAYDLAGQYKAKVSSPPPGQTLSSATTSSLLTLHPSHFRYLQATAELDKAEFLARLAAQAKSLLAAEASLKPVLETAGVKVPLLEDPAGATASLLSSTQAASRKSFTNALDALGRIDGGDSPPEIKVAAQAETLFAQYGWSVLENDAGDAQAAANHLQMAKTARDASLQANANLPTLPAELAVVPPATPPAH